MLKKLLIAGMSISLLLISYLPLNAVSDRCWGCDDVNCQEEPNGWTVCMEYHGPYGDVCSLSGSECP